MGSALHSSGRRQRRVQGRVACLAQQRVQECDALHGFAQACSGSRSSAWVTQQQAMHRSPLDTSPIRYAIIWLTPLPAICDGRAGHHGLPLQLMACIQQLLNAPLCGRDRRMGCIPMSSAKTPPLPWLYCQNTQRTPSN